uniref:Neur_chan_LBD domain-containing protein n=1 Tax=Strongyloides papillosus TaxID=174720 RepID=A0A0N5CG89_STREA
MEDNEVGKLNLSVNDGLYLSYQKIPYYTLEENSGISSFYKLENYLLNNYNPNIIPQRNRNNSVNVSFTINLYQIIEINELQQYIKINCWVVEKWEDPMLYWNPDDFEGIDEIILPEHNVWKPDTTLYNSLVMEDSASKRLQHVKLNTNNITKTTTVEMLYPAIYKSSCIIDLRYFPFDYTKCQLTFGSWIFDNKAIDYFHGSNISNSQAIGTKHCLPNEGFDILSTSVERKVMKYACCVNNYTLLEYTLYIQRKPLYYIVNLVAPTGIITLIAIIGFFSSSTLNDVREEKISLGITTLLSMTFIILAVSDKMPSTSAFIPLIGWFYNSMILLISLGTIAASYVIYVQKKGIIGKRPDGKVMKIFVILGKILWLEIPLLMKQAYSEKARLDKLKKANQKKMSVWQKWQSLSKDVKKMKKSSSMLNSSNVVENTNIFPSLLSNQTPKTEDQPTSTSNKTSQSKDSTNNNTACTCFCNENAISVYEGTCYCNNNASKSVLDEDTTFDFKSSIVTDDASVGNQSASEFDSFSIGNRERSKLNLLGGLENDDSLYKYISNDGGKDSPGVIKLSRNLAELEYDWLAAVVERFFLLVFFLLFIMLGVGINCIGLYHWIDTREQLLKDPDFS